MSQRTIHLSARACTCRPSHRKLSTAPEKIEEGLTLKGGVDESGDTVTRNDLTSLVARPSVAVTLTVNEPENPLFGATVS